MAAPSDTPESNNNDKTSLAVLSGSKIMVLENSTKQTFDPYPDFTPAVPVSSLAWNHNQMVIATASGISTDQMQHDNIVLLSSQSGKPLDSFQHDLDWKQQQQQKLKGNAAVTSVGFGGKSRYLCIGDESGAVCLWDLKKKVRVRQFFHTVLDKPDPSIQVSLDPTDTFVLSLSPSSLYQYNLRDGQLVGRIGMPPLRDGNDIDVAHFTKFCISDLEPNLVALGSDDGRVFVMDMQKENNHDNSRELLEMAQHHSGQVTGLAFHKNFVFSCGTDGTLFVHNKSDQTSYTVTGALESNVSSIVCMSLHANGSTLAVAFESGDVSLYDLDLTTFSTTLRSTIPANGPVRAVSFAPPPRVKTKKSSTTKTTNETTTTNPTPKEIPVKSPEKSSAASPFARKLVSLKTLHKKDNQKASGTPTRAPLSPRKLSPSPNHYNRGKEQTPPSQVSTEQIREVVRDEVENLQDEMEEQLRNLHIDMINQFQQQSQEMQAIMAKHFEALEQLRQENQQLRQENEALRRGR